MTVFNRRRLDNRVFKLDVERMRRAWYSDKYFENVHRMLGARAASGYRYDGQYPRDIGIDVSAGSAGPKQAAEQIECWNEKLAQR